MIAISWAKLHALMFDTIVVETHPAASRLAVPHSFKPNLSVKHAAVASLIAFARIFLGALLFAFWGTYTLVVLSRIQNPLLRFTAVLFLIPLFPVLGVLLMVGISSAVRWLVRLSRLAKRSSVGG